MSAQDGEEHETLYPGIGQALRGIHAGLSQRLHGDEVVPNVAQNDLLHVQAVCLEFSETYPADNGMNTNQCFTVFGATKRQLL
jgi:hypothetical protein